MLRFPNTQETRLRRIGRSRALAPFTVYFPRRFVRAVPGPITRAGSVTQSSNDANATRLSRGDEVFIGLIVFLGGMTSIGTELSVSRLIAPFFGDSTFIWANVIGLTLTFLAIGYWLGGRLADRYPRPWVLYSITALAAVWCALLPYLARPILQVSLDAFDDVAVGAFYGSLLGVLLILSVPITLLGFVSPYAIRLRVPDVTHAGNTSGNIYALGTVGSIAGSFLPVLVLIPWVGTRRTFLILGALLFIPSVIGLLRVRAMPQAALATVLAVAVAIVSLSAPAGRSGPPRAERSSTKPSRATTTSRSCRTVRPSSFPSTRDTPRIRSTIRRDPLTRGPWDYFMVAPLFYPQTGPAAIDNALLIGLAGGTVAKQLTAAYGPIPIDGVEIDPAIAEVGREWFDMTEPNLNVIINDGRYVLRTSDETVRPDRRRRLQAALHPLPAHNPGVLPGGARSPDTRRCRGHQCRAHRDVTTGWST